MVSVAPEDILAELNACRTDPSRYSRKVGELLSNFQGTRLDRPGRSSLFTTEGVGAVHDALRDLNGRLDIQPLVLSQGMSRAAQAYCDDCGPSGYTGFQGGSKPSLDSRLSAQGQWSGDIDENVVYDCVSAEEIVVKHLVDDGNESRSHRRKILNPKFKFVGIGFGPHSRMETMCNICFASTFTAPFDDVVSVSLPTELIESLRQEAPRAHPALGPIQMDIKPRNETVLELPNDLEIQKPESDEDEEDRLTPPLRLQLS